MTAPRVSAIVRRRRKVVGRLILPLLLICALLLAQGCAATRFHEREKLNDRAMQFDSHGGLTYVRTKIDAAREGAIGGYGSAVAGGCGCQ